jgi:hypothetical protein
MRSNPERWENPVQHPQGLALPYTTVSLGGGHLPELKHRQPAFPRGKGGADGSRDWDLTPVWALMEVLGLGATQLSCLQAASWGCPAPSPTRGSASLCKEQKEYVRSWTSTSSSPSSQQPWDIPDLVTLCNASFSAPHILPAPDP